MLLRLLMRLIWGTTKFAVRFVVIPIVISAATAAVLGALTDKIRASTPNTNGAVDQVIRPER